MNELSENILIEGEEDNYVRTLDQNTILYDGDIIKLTTAKKLPSEIMSLAEANLSPKNITVSVIGKVVLRDIEKNQFLQYSDLK